MRIVSTLLIVSMLTAGCPLQSAERALAAAPAKVGAIPRLPNGKPDLSGHWAEPFVPNMAAREKDGRSMVLDPKARQPMTFPRMGEALPDARASAFGAAARRSCSRTTPSRCCSSRTPGTTGCRPTG